MASETGPDFSQQHATVDGSTRWAMSRSQRLAWSKRVPAQELSSRLQRLARVVGASSDEQLSCFLTHARLDDQQLVGLLSGSPAVEGKQRRRWMQILDEDVKTPDGDPSRQERRDRACLPAEPLPYEELLLPWVRSGRQQLQSASWQLVSEQARADLEHWLLKDLVELAGPTIALSLAEEHQANGLQEAEEPVGGETFFQQMWSFLEEYPVLARLLSLRVEQWVQACTDLLLHLEADHDALAALFQQGQLLGEVEAIQTGCSDPHHGGRSVQILRFASGRRLIYKPRCLAAEQAFFALLAWCNAAGLTPDLKTVLVQSRPTHGWMEYVPSAPCSTREEVQHSYQRAGMLLRLLSVLGSVDMHKGNLIACGPHPVLIDLETILSPGPWQQPWHGNRWLTKPQHDDHSVLQTGLLPSTAPVIGIAREHCGLLAAGEAAPHVVRLGEQRMNPADFVEELLVGFRRMHGFLQDHRDALCEPQGPLSLFRGCPIRVLFRPTWLYGKQLVRLRHPTFLRNEAERWIDVQVFKRPLLQRQAGPALWRLAEAEGHALEQLDVPWFGTNAESRDLSTGDGTVIADLFALSALEQVQSRLNQLDERNLWQQIALIRSALGGLPSTEAQEHIV